MDKVPPIRSYHTTEYPCTQRVSTTPVIPPDVPTDVTAGRGLGGIGGTTLSADGSKENGQERTNLRRPRPLGIHASMTAENSIVLFSPPPSPTTFSKNHHASAVIVTPIPPALFRPYYGAPRPQVQPPGRSRVPFSGNCAGDAMDPEKCWHQPKGRKQHDAVFSRHRGMDAECRRPRIKLPPKPIFRRSIHRRSSRERHPALARRRGGSPGRRGGGGRRYERGDRKKGRDESRPQEGSHSEAHADIGHKGHRGAELAGLGDILSQELDAHQQQEGH